MSDEYDPEFDTSRLYLKIKLGRTGITGATEASAKDRLASGRGGRVVNVVGTDARTLIARQAREWLIRMDGDELLTDVETAALKEWMSRSALHRNELARLSRFWNQANILTALIGSFETARRERKEKRLGASWIGVLITAGAVLSSVILTYCNLR